MTVDWLEQIKWNSRGLVPVIAQDSGTGKVLMLAWMNQTALQQTVARGEAVYWSRSRDKLWHKGEKSGNFQRVHSIRLDCDRDTILLEVEQQGGVACHTGRKHCFFRQLQDEHWITVDSVVRDPEQMYGS